MEGKSSKEQEKHLLQGLNSGKLKIVLHGEKLHGEFAIVKASGRGENAWLFMKLKDEYASTEDILQNDKSVQSGLTIDEVKVSSTNIYGSSDSENDKSDKNKKSTKPTSGMDINELLKKAPESKIPLGIKPALA